jgi:transglutaminase-like putative cysteine protease
MVSRARFLAPFALTALSAAAALSLGRVFATGRFLVPVLVAVALAHGAGALARWRAFPPWATALLQAGLLLAFVLVVLGPRFGALGLTLGSSDVSLATQLERGWDLLRTAPPPAPVTDGALLLAVIVSYTVAAVGDWLAFRRDTVLAATAPALVLFVWAATLGTDDHATGTVLVFAGAAASFLLVQNVAVLDRGRSWLVSQEAPRRHWLAPAVALVAVAVLAGVALAPVVPGAGSDPVLDFADTGGDGSGGGSYRTGIAPLVDVSQKLDQVDDDELFTVTAPAPDYWRVAALDQFSTENGGQWTLQASGDEVEVGLPDPGEAGSRLRQQYDITALGERWLPAAYRPVAIDLDDTLVVKSSSTLVADEDSVAGLRYSVDSELPLGAASVTAAMQAATAQRVPAAVRQYAEVPPELPAGIGDIAAEVVRDAGATTPYAQAAALRDFFRSGAFTYDLTVDPNDSPDAILAFLRDRRGFCVQFATAYAVMARTLGIPARVAVGFTPGDLRNGTFHVSAHDAHAWPELWLNGLGWTHLFDPTPAADEQAQPGGSALPGEAVAPPPTQQQQTPDDTPNTTLPPQGTAPPAPGSGSGTVPAPRAEPAPTPVVSADDESGGTSPWLPVVVVVLLVAAVVVAYVLVVTITKARRRARRRRGGPGDAVQGAWDEALDQLRDARVPTDPALTPLELARVIPQGAPAATRPLRDLARRYTTARYGSTPPTVDDADRAWASFDALSEALESDLGWRERWRRRLDPTTLRARERSG